MGSGAVPRGEKLLLELALCRPAPGQPSPSLHVGAGVALQRPGNSPWERFSSRLVTVVPGAVALPLLAGSWLSASGTSVLGRCPLGKVGAFLL